MPDDQRNLPGDDADIGNSQTPLISETVSPVVENERAAANLRPGIRHLLLWTAFVAVALGYQRFQYPDQDFLAWEVGVVLFNSTIFGLTLAAPILALARWCRGIRFPSQPGEWLLLSFGIYSWLDSIGTLLISQLEDGNLYEVDFMRWARYTNCLSLSLGLIGTLMLTMAALKSRREGSWFAFFCIGALMYANYSGQSFDAVLSVFLEHGTGYLPWLDALQNTATVASRIGFAVALVIAIVVDAIQKTPRGWLHFVGVSATGAVIAFEIGKQIFAWLLPGAV